MIDFGESYKKIMNQVKRDIHTEGDNKNKQIAMAILLVVECGIRVGSEKYRDENNSYGATTLEPRHFKIKGEIVEVDFIGKKGVRNTGKIRSKRLSKNLRIKKRTFRSNEPIFAYRTGNKWYSLKNIDVNKYLKKFGNFSSKNFRTWVANLSFITELLNTDKDLSESQKKTNVNKCVEKVAEKLNNNEYKIKKLSTENNELYGSVKPTEISKLIHEIDKIEIKPSMIQPIKEIKSLGKFKVKITLHSEIDAEILIKVETAETIQ